MNTTDNANLVRSMDAISSHLKCAICLSVSNAPIMTPCGHLFCKNCMVEHLLAATKEGREVTCPTCMVIIEVRHIVQSPLIRAISEILAAYESRFEDVHAPTISSPVYSEAAAGGPVGALYQLPYVHQNDEITDQTLSDFEFTPFMPTVEQVVSVFGVDLEVSLDMGQDYGPPAWNNLTLPKEKPTKKRKAFERFPVARKTVDSDSSKRYSFCPVDDQCGSCSIFVKEHENGVHHRARRACEQRVVRPKTSED